MAGIQAIYRIEEERGGSRPPSDWPLHIEPR